MRYGEINNIANRSTQDERLREREQQLRRIGELKAITDAYEKQRALATQNPRSQNEVEWPYDEVGWKATYNKALLTDTKRCSRGKEEEDLNSQPSSSRARVLLASLIWG